MEPGILRTFIDWSSALSTTNSNEWILWMLVTQRTLSSSDRSRRSVYSHEEDATFHSPRQLNSIHTHPPMCKQQSSGLDAGGCRLSCSQEVSKAQGERAKTIHLLKLIGTVDIPTTCLWRRVTHVLTWPLFQDNHVDVESVFVPLVRYTSLQQRRCHLAPLRLDPVVQL